MPAKPRCKLRVRKLAPTFVKLALQLKRCLEVSCSIARCSCTDEATTIMYGWIMLFRTRHLELELASLTTGTLHKPRRAGPRYVAGMLKMTSWNFGDDENPCSMHCTERAAATASCTPCRPSENMSTDHVCTRQDEVFRLLSPSRDQPQPTQPA